MKKLLVLIGLIACLTVSSQTDSWYKSFSGDVTGTDTSFYETGSSWRGKLVTMEVNVRNLSGTVGKIDLGGYDRAATIRLGAQDFKSYVQVDLDTTGTVLQKNGDWYGIKYYIPECPFDHPAFRYTPSTVTDLDMEVLFILK